MKLRNLKAKRVLGAVIVAVAVAGFFAFRELRPVSPGQKPHPVRIAAPTSLYAELENLQRAGYIRSAREAGFLATIMSTPKTIEVGTYDLGPGMSAVGILRSLARPIHRMLRLPAQDWAVRMGKLLQEHDVCSETDYIAEVDNPQSFQSEVDFPLPKGSLEGYLYGGSYDLPPLTPAKDVVTSQLKAFQSKVYDPLGKPANLQKLLTVASLIELEVYRDEERPLVSSVIYNRINKKMRLQIDASVNYALGVWRPLTLKDLKTAPGPYNLYKVAGLPPGPICNPTVKSIAAAMAPAKDDYLFYVALPSGKTLFASNFRQHEANIRLRKLALGQIPRTPASPKRPR